MQKFNKYDLVRIAKDLGKSMAHFTNDVDAIIMGSYKDLCGGDDTDSYEVYIKGKGSVAWYYESQLTLISKERKDIFNSWKSEQDAMDERESDLDYIFGNPGIPLTSGQSIEALAACFGITNLWGKNGEGFVWQYNAAIVVHIAQPFVNAGDKEGWLAYCQQIKDTKTITITKTVP